MDTNRHVKYSLFALMVFGLAVVTGCAGTQGSNQTLQPLPEGVQLTQYSQVDFTLKSKSDISMTKVDMDRILTQIIKQLRNHESNHYQSINENREGQGTIEASLLFTQYDPGNAFGRFMLAGLGSIHVDAEVTLRDKSNGQVLTRQRVTKTFAWGGLYGGMTSIQDVEEGFAKGVVGVLLGEEGRHSPVKN